MHEVLLVRAGTTATTVRREHFWPLFATSTPLVALLTGLGMLPLWQQNVALGAANTVLATSLFAIGLVLLAEPGQGRPGIAMMISAALLVLSWGNEWGTSPLPFLSNQVGGFWLLASGWALYRYPDQRLGRGDTVVFRFLLGWFLITPFAADAVSRPEWHLFPADTWWPALAPHRTAFTVVSDVIDLGAVLLLLVYVGLWIQKIRRARPAVVRIKLPVAAAGVVAAVLGLLVPVGRALDWPESVMRICFAIGALGVNAVPLAFLVSVLRRFMARSNIADLLLQLTSRPSPRNVAHALRVALGDPQLDIAYWSAERRDYVLEGQSAPVAWTGENDMVVRVTSSDGSSLAQIRLDAATAHDADFVVAVVTAFSLTLENALLVQTVEQQLADLREVSARIVEAGDVERRRIEQNLHDGAQQRFLALGLLMGAEEATTKDPRTAQALEHMRSELRTAVNELRDLARGLHPSVLRLGLRTAIEETGRNHEFTLRVDLPEVELPEVVELTAYYAISEALTNAARHAQATEVSVRAVLTQDQFHVTVTDDGRGGASPGSGRGLGGIADRVTALGGTSRITSPDGGGTRIELRIPCV